MIDGWMPPSREPDSHFQYLPTFNCRERSSSVSSNQPLLVVVQEQAPTRPSPPSRVMAHSGGSHGICCTGFIAPFSHIHTHT